MAHALGFYHEQSNEGIFLLPFYFSIDLNVFHNAQGRSDRDDWVTINWSNIPVGKCDKS